MKKTPYSPLCILFRLNWDNQSSEHEWWAQTWWRRTHDPVMWSSASCLCHDDWRVPSPYMYVMWREVSLYFKSNQNCYRGKRTIPYIYIICFTLFYEEPFVLVLMGFYKQKSFFFLYYITFREKLITGKLWRRGRRLCVVMCPSTYMTSVWSCLWPLCIT